MAASKINIRINFGAFITYFLSFAFLLAGYLVYSLLPGSENFTNSIEVSGEKTVRVFMIAPIFCVLSLVAFTVFLIVFRKYLKELSFSDNKIGKTVISNGIINAFSYGSLSVIIVIILVCTGFAFAAYNEFKELGFVAPMDGTVYETYGWFILAGCVVHFIFLALTTVKMCGLSVGSWINKSENKS